ncbi:MAG: hypothetical protein O3A39_04020 [Proteobacteria bacterium]|nr:hypothetical protein [Pseudomonadota bacterium]
MRDPIKHGGLNDPDIVSGGIVSSGNFRLNKFQRATVSEPRSRDPRFRGPGMRQAKVSVKGIQKVKPVGLGSIVTPESVSARAGMRANFSWPSLNFNNNKRYNPYT